jgi:chemotaxis protein MotB
LADVLTSNPDYTATIESHTDASGSPDELQKLTNDRVESIMARLASLNVPTERVKGVAMGAALPIAPNTTAANRAKNRRVQIILTPAL